MTTSGTDQGGTYIYAVVRGGPPPRFSMRAVANPEARIRTLEVGHVTAVVSDVPPGALTATKADVLAHSEVLEELLGVCTAVAPFRFGTVFADDDTTCRELLELRADELEFALSRVEGCVQIRVKCFYLEEPVLREIVTESRRVRDLRLAMLPAGSTLYQQIELGEQVAAALAEKRARDAGALLDRLTPLAVEHIVEEEPHEWAVLSASFLVGRTGVGRFDRAVGRFADEQQDRLRLRFVGPLPPYSFVDLALDAVGVV